MSRVLKIVSVAVLLFLSYMWINVLTKSCNKSREIEFPNQKETLVKGDDEFGKEDFFEENDTINSSVSNDTLSPKNVKEPIDYTEIDKTIDENTKTKAEPTITLDSKKPKAEPKEKEVIVIEKPVKPNTLKSLPEVKISPVKSGNYVVIAGNYLVESNADVMIKRLKKAGFSAEKVIFNLSEFHTVIVGRYKDNADAAKTASNLKVKGFDVYVQKPK